MANTVGARGATSKPRFDYAEAFLRNLGWLSEREQETLRGKRIAIAGLGGVGGAHLLTLARLGIGRFSIADFDTFDLVNFNRQAGATMATLGMPKVAALSEMALQINPGIDLRSFDRAIDAGNVDPFLQDVDCFVDGLDFFAFDARATVFAACQARGIPAVTAAPIGMGVALLNFLPGRMSFEHYFRFNGHSDAERAVRFLAGLAPSMLHRGYLVDPSRVDLAARRGPSTAMACQLCAGVAATEVLKILLGRGPMLAAPWGLHFDAYSYRLRKTWRPGGNANPLQGMLMSLVRRAYKG